MRLDTLFDMPGGLIGEGGAIALTPIAEPRTMQLPMSRNSAPPKRRRRRRRMGRNALGLVGFLVLATPASAIQLVTEQEAALPPDRLPGLVLRGSPTRRPSVVVVSPPPTAGVLKSPLSIKVKLQAHG
ncbi:MAG TPA: hypothetical protein VGN55_01895, partial [Xanthobacteraceae bacterium]